MKFVDTITGRPNTIKTKKSLFINWIEPIYLEELSPGWYIQYWQENGLKPRTIKSLLSILSEYHTFKTGKTIESHKSQLSSVIRSEQTALLKTLTRPQAAKLIKLCKQNVSDDKLAVLIAIHTGMRKGEVFGLTWGDVDLLRGRIIVQRSYNGPTKNGKSRIIPISSTLEKVLLARMPINSDNCIEDVKILKQFDPNPYLKALCKKADIPTITFHNLRHTFATLALESGKSPKIVQETLGHSNVSTTLDIYWGSTQERIDLDFLPEI